MTRRFQFSLRTALVTLTLLGVCLGIIASRAQRQRDAVKAIEALGGRVESDLQREWVTPAGNNSDPSASGLSWLRRLIGDDYFQSVECVYICGSADETVRAIPHLKRLKGLKILVFANDQSAMKEVGAALPQCKIVGVAF